MTHVDVIYIFIHVYFPIKKKLNRLTLPGKIRNSVWQYFSLWWPGICKEPSRRDLGKTQRCMLPFHCKFLFFSIFMSLFYKRFPLGSLASLWVFFTRNFILADFSGWEGSIWGGREKERRRGTVLLHLMPFTFFFFFWWLTGGVELI